MEFKIEITVFNPNQYNFILYLLWL